jgi:hypothetical protein
MTGPEARLVEIAQKILQISREMSENTPAAQAEVSTIPVDPPPYQPVGPASNPVTWLPFSPLEARIILYLAEQPATLEELAGRLDMAHTRVKHACHELKERRCLCRGERGLHVPAAEIAVAARTSLHT